MNFIIVIVLLALNIPVFKGVFGMMFSSMEDFNESLRYVFTPDIFSLFRGEYMKDYFGELKVSFFVGICALIVFLEYLFVQFIIGVFAG